MLPWEETSASLTSTQYGQYNTDILSTYIDPGQEVVNSSLKPKQLRSFQVTLAQVLADWGSDVTLLTATGGFFAACPTTEAKVKHLMESTEGNTQYFKTMSGFLNRVRWEVEPRGAVGFCLFKSQDQPN